MRRASEPRVCCIGLDGTPYGLLRRLIDGGVMPNLAAIVREGRLRPMRSVHPWVSSVAWTTLQTGVNPGHHGIFGFIDRDPATLKTYIPLANRIRYPSVWDVLGRAGKRSVVLNVPVTYPATPISGAMVSGFLAPMLNEKAVYPATLLPQLQRLGYRVDSEPHLARQDKAAAMDDLRDALGKRCATFLHLMDSQPWDLFLGVLMETDRLHHFFYSLMEARDPVFAPAFDELYHEVDAFVGQARDRLGPRDRLVLLSDHGSCAIRQEVYYNRWLADAGYLRYTQEPALSLEHLHPDSIAYSLDPARIFLNVKGRERDGRVQPGLEYERLRDEIVAAAEALSISDSGQPVRPVVRAYRREELYTGPLVHQAADVIVAPRDGYDPKAAFYPAALQGRSDTMVGMHSFGDAFVYVGGEGGHASDGGGQATDGGGHGGGSAGCDSDGGGRDGRAASILDVAPTILEALRQPIPPEYEGCSLL